MKSFLMAFTCTLVTSLCFSQTYTFTGNGNWSEATNWSNNNIPPATLLPGDTIYISPAPGQNCLLNIPTQIISEGAGLVVTSGAHFIITGELNIHDSIPVISEENIVVNPSGYAPLTAKIFLKTSIKTTVTIRVMGKNGTGSDVLKEFTDLDTLHTIPVLGLYAGYDNTVELTFKNSRGASVKQKLYSITTQELPSDTYPLISIDTATSQMSAGMTLVSYFGYKTNPTPQTPFMFDAYGDIRWYLDFTTSPDLNNVYYDDGLERLQNGNLYFGNSSNEKIYEINFLGETINTWLMPGYDFHHNVQEKPNGNFIVSVSKLGLSTTEDFIIEIDRTTKQIINTWDLNQSLQYNRKTLTTNTVDWIHVNALIYDPVDSTIIISGRTQGVVKLDSANKVVWILSNHKGWGLAGDGTDLTNFLLQPLDNNDLPITDQDVLDGNTNHPDFEWCWYQHAPLIMPNGNLMLFDNGGNNRNYSGAGQYSRAVEYNINETNKTVKQVWQYGKERGAATFSPIVSDVDYNAEDDHVIFSPGSVRNPIYGKVIEVDYSTKNILFEATIAPPRGFGNITFHRTERMSLYQ